MSCPFPESSSFIQAVRASSRSLRENSGVKISHERIHQLLKSKAFSSTFKKLSQNHGLILPLKFPSRLAELNLVSLLALVNFGSGYRVPLHAQTGRGAWDSIRALVLSLYITSSTDDGDLLSAQSLKSMSTWTVASMMNIPTHVERPHETIPGVIVGEVGGPLFELVKLITSTFNDTGKILLSQGYPNLGSFILEALKEGERRGKTCIDNDVVLEKVVRAIPGFRDMALVNGQPVYMFKKALFLLYGIQQRFAGDNDIPTPDVSTLPIFSDNVIPSMLVHLGIIDLSEVTSVSLSKSFKVLGDPGKLLEESQELTPEERKASQARTPREGPILSESDALILRASAIDACEIIVEEAHKMDGEENQWLKNLTLPELDAWLWAGAKDRPDYRELERFVLRGTVFF